MCLSYSEITRPYKLHRLVYQRVTWENPSLDRMPAGFFIYGPRRSAATWLCDFSFFLCGTNGISPRKICDSPIKNYGDSMAGWWFGTMEFWMTFHSVGNEKIIPTDFHSIIFQRGRYTTHQPVWENHGTKELNGKNWQIFLGKLGCFW